jgi:uncharacterized protein YndB with AHSA1/START domain
MTGTETERKVTIARIYDAPRERVWRAWTEPERLARWWGRRGWNTPLDSIVMDVRPGGTFRLTSVSETGETMEQSFFYIEVSAPERLVLGGEHGMATVTFADLGDGRTEMTLQTSIALAHFEAAVAGLGSAFDRLAEVLR